MLNVVRQICAETGARPALFYLAEAHAAETWPLSENAPSVHGNVEQRVAAACSLLDKYPEMSTILEGRVYVDQLDNATTLAHGLWPERYLLLEGCEVKWASTLSFEARLADVPAQLAAAARELWA